MPSLNPRPKRGGEEFSRSHYHSSDTQSSKKPRFDTRNPAALVPDAPEEDEVLNADEIGKRGQQTKRNAVNIDGYASDSSNEGFSARVEKKAKQSKDEKAPKEEDEKDMFAELEDDFADKDSVEAEMTGKKKKAVKFLDVEDIEGQVRGSRSGGHVSSNFSAEGPGRRRTIDKDVESSSDSEVGDEERAGVGSDIDEELGAGAKKKHAPKLEAFNLRSENEEGGFDEHGNFVRKAQDPDAVYDTWMEGLSKKEMKKARAAHEQREKERSQKRLEDDSKTTKEILEALIPNMGRGETILEALARLGRGKETKRPKWQNKSKVKRNQEMDIDRQTEVEDSAETKRRKTVEVITGAADLLMSRGNAEIYETDRELLTRMYKRETEEEWVDEPEDASPHVSKKWLYRWSNGTEIHGPYESDTMLAWNSAGYFGEGVEFKRAEDELGECESSADF